MAIRVLYIERKTSEYVSIERAFRSIASSLAKDVNYEFQQAPFGPRIWHTIGNLLFFRKKRADIYHITGAVHYLALVLPRRRTILSIMDCRFLYDESGLRYWLLKKLYLDWPLRRASRITAISEQTKREIIQYSGCPEEMIKVLELPLTLETDSDAQPQFNEQLPTILQVGTMPNKNVPNVARAIRGLTVRLKLIGRVDPDLEAVLKENGIDYDFDFELTDEEMHEEYRKCDLVVFCSKFEGFGLPIIEGQSMGKPVITSNLSPMTETAGSGALLVDPEDVDAIRAAVLQIVNDRDLRNELIKAGYENVDRFSPRTIANRYESLYRELLGSV